MQYFLKCYLKPPSTLHCGCFILHFNCWMRSNILSDGPTFISKSSMISSFVSCSIIGPVMLVKLTQYGWQSFTVRNLATSAVVQSSGSTVFNMSNGTVVLTSRGITLSSSVFASSLGCVSFDSVLSSDASVGGTVVSVGVLCNFLLKKNIVNYNIYTKITIKAHRQKQNGMTSIITQKN